MCVWGEAVSLSGQACEDLSSAESDLGRPPLSEAVLQWSCTCALFLSGKKERRGMCSVLYVHVIALLQHLDARSLAERAAQSVSQSAVFE